MTNTALHRITVDFVSCDRQTLPDLLGRALHAQVMQWLQAGNPELARQVHDANLTPFSLSPLRTRSPRLRSGDRVHLTIGILQGDLLQPLFAGLCAWEQQVCSWANLTFKLERVNAIPGSDPRVQASSYEAIAAQDTLGTDVELRFHSPMSFKQKQGIQMFPLPELVFDGLRRRWNHFAPDAVQIPELDWGGWVAAYDLKSQAWKGQGGVEIGAIGWVRYRFADPYIQDYASMLARFAEFAGVGRKTAQGFGYTELVLKRGRGSAGQKPRPKLQPK